MSKLLNVLILRKGEGFWMYVWKTLCLIVALSIAFVGLLLFYAFCRNVVYFRWIRPAVVNRAYEVRYISGNIALEYLMYGKGIRVMDRQRDEVLLKGLDWVAVPDGLTDTLAVFCKDGKRGYLNRFTGQVEIAAQYKRAWVFSEGLACVETEDCRLVFIDREGEVVIDKGLRYSGRFGGYLFHDGVCRAEDYHSGKVGLIDTLGRWVLEPEYDDVVSYADFWQVRKDGLNGLLTKDMDTVFTVSYPRMSIGDDYIEVGYTDHTVKVFDYDCNVLEDFLIDEVENLYYPTGGLRDSTRIGEAGNVLYALASCRVYRVCGGSSDGNYYGLMSGDGRILTPPSYRKIQAVGKDLYLCSPHGTLLDSRGRRLN